MSAVHIIDLLLVVAILIVVGVPLFSSNSKSKLYASQDEMLEEFKHLQVRKDEVLLSIKELEFDFKTDKLSPADYEDTHKGLEAEAMVILERMDELESLKKQSGKSRSKKANAA